MRSDLQRGTATYVPQMSCQAKLAGVDFFYSYKQFVRLYLLGSFSLLLQKKKLKKGAAYYGAGQYTPTGK